MKDRTYICCDLNNAEEKRQEILFLPWSFARAGSVPEPMPGVPASQIVAA